MRVAAGCNTFAAMIPPISRRSALLLLLGAALLYAFLRLGAEPFYVGDESRGGVNALEMLANGDWVNLHYLGAPDEVRGKPPFLIWCISGSMALFGQNAFALRFPSAVAITLFFYVLFQLITLYRSPGFALATGLVLLSVNGIAGWHVGRTGDFDALLLLFLTSGLLFLLRYLDFGYRRDMLGAGFCWGFAFLTKGLAMGALVPGLLLYLVLTKRLGQVLRDRHFWAGVGVFLLFPLFWYTVIQRYGATWEDPVYTGRNAFERLVVHDIWERFTQNDFEGRSTTSRPGYFLYSLDKMFNLWSIAFFAFLGYGLYRAVRMGHGALDWLRARRLLLLSLCLWFPYAVILSFTPQALRQYIVPVLPYVGIATVWGFDYFSGRYPRVQWLFAGLLAFTLLRHLYEINTPRQAPPITAHLPAVARAERIYMEPNALANDDLFYVYLTNQAALHFDSTTTTGRFDLVVLRKDSPRARLFPERDTLLVTESAVVLR